MPNVLKTNTITISVRAIDLLSIAAWASSAGFIAWDAADGNGIDITSTIGLFFAGVGMTLTLIAWISRGMYTAELAFRLGRDTAARDDQDIGPAGGTVVDLTSRPGPKTT